MAATMLIEEEQGTYIRTPHPHNGYYAGDFTGLPVHLPAPPAPRPA